MSLEAFPFGNRGIDGDFIAIANLARFVILDTSVCWFHDPNQPTFGQICIYVIISTNPSIKRIQKTYNFLSVYKFVYKRA